MTSPGPDERYIQPDPTADQESDQPKIRPSATGIYGASALELVTNDLYDGVIDLTSVSPQNQARLIILAGNNHADSVRQAVSDFRGRQPDGPQPFFVIPGTVESGLKDYDQKAGRGVYSQDKVIRRRSLEFQGKLIEQAIKFEKQFPEASLARQAWREWHGQELSGAADAMATLIAVCGLRINRALMVRQQAAMPRPKINGRYPQSMWQHKL